MGGGNLASGVVVRENEVLVGQLTENQLWRLVEIDLWFPLLAASMWLAAIYLGLTLRLCILSTVFLLGVEDLVDVGDSYIIFHLAGYLVPTGCLLPSFGLSKLPLVPSL